MIFEDFENIKQIIIMATLVYFSIVVILRSFGKRTLLSLTAFDFLVTVTIGSIASKIILSPDVTFADGLAALITLVLLKYLVSKANIHFKFINKMLRAGPTLLYYNGEYLKKNLDKMRMTKEEVRQEVRIQSGNVIENIDAVILESNGTVSVVSNIGSENLIELFKELEGDK